MDNFEDIINEMFILLKGCSRGYVIDKNIKQVCRTRAKLISQINGAFSCIIQVEPTFESIREAGSFAASSIDTSRKLELSVTPK